MVAGEAKAHNRYRVIERLESGGMAEVFRGEAESLAGFKKAVAIKRVLPHLAANDKFIRMFLDEARLCARLNHANIVQVFDIGHVENTYFIVMEFVDGVNLKAIVDHLRNRNQGLSIPIAIFIAMQICNGLQYAHDVADGDGVSLNIVHRDMSPPNVLVSKRGEVKIVDFGLAKATTQLEKSEQGMVKGKFSYLAPETALGEHVDHQADIFAVGIMLWELIANKRLFLGDTDWATVRQVQQAVIPSLVAENPDVTADLEEVIRKALAKNKAERYQSAEALAQDLAEYLAKHRMAVNSFDLARITKEAIEERRLLKIKEKRPEQDLIDKLIAEELNRFTSLDEAEGDDGEGSRPINLSDVSHGSKPLDPGGFVDTSDWASGMFDGEDFDPQSLSQEGPIADLASQLEGDDLSPLAPPSEAPEAIQEPAKLASKEAPKGEPADKPAEKTKPAKQASEEPTKQASPPAETAVAADLATVAATDAKPAGKSNSGLMATVAIFALLAVGAGLYFAGVIGH
ncbi:MAG: protein kinase [Deltaproteobacteria bacterium]|nr:protein kinase [Deltaproteobacteria bacterium]